MDARPALGRAGEDLAAQHYRRLGYRVLERNYRCRYGEIDLVARKDRQLVFCEVKTRTAGPWGLPAEAVGWRKQQRLRQLATHWLSERRPGRVDVRFDVVSVIVRGSRFELTHLTDAF